MSANEQKKSRVDAEAAHLFPLVGKRVERIITDGHGLYGLGFADGTLAWILCDPEGNGPGFLSVDTSEVKT